MVRFCGNNVSTLCMHVCNVSHGWGVGLQSVGKHYFKATLNREEAMDDVSSSLLRFGGGRILSRQSRHQVPLELGLLLPVGQRIHGAEAVHDVVRVAEVDLVQRAPNH